MVSIQGAAAAAAAASAQHSVLTSCSTEVPATTPGSAQQQASAEADMLPVGCALICRSCGCAMSGW
jgi:hypothetical protein